MIPRRHNECGFTLIEIMLAFVIATIVLSIAYSVLDNTVNTTLRLKKYTEPSQIAQQLMATVVRDFESAFLPPNQRLSFYATADDQMVRFLSSVDSSVMPDGRQGDRVELAYRVMASDNGVSVYRRESPFIDGRPLEGGTFALIGKDLKAFSLSYYDGTEWREQWDNMGTESIGNKDKGLPKAIRIRLEIDDEHKYATVVKPIAGFFGSEG